MPGRLDCHHEREPALDANGDVERDRGRHDEARPLYDEALDIHMSERDGLGQAHVEGNSNARD